MKPTDMPDAAEMRLIGAAIHAVYLTLIEAGFSAAESIRLIGTVLGQALGVALAEEGA